MQNTKRKNGFTLVEVLFAVLLVGLAITSLMAANLALTNANGAGSTLSTAQFLLEQIKELTAQLPVVDPQTGTDTFGPEEASLAAYDDLDDFDTATFSPPIDAARVTLSDFSAFTQQITVQNINASNFEQVVSDHSSPFVKVTVEVFLNSKPITSSSWIRAAIE